MRKGRSPPLSYLDCAVHGVRVSGWRHFLPLGFYRAPEEWTGGPSVTEDEQRPGPLVRAPGVEERQGRLPTVAGDRQGGTRSDTASSGGTVEVSRV